MSRWICAATSTPDHSTPRLTERVRKMPRRARATQNVCKPPPRGSCRASCLRVAAPYPSSHGAAPRGTTLKPALLSWLAAGAPSGKTFLKRHRCCSLDELTPRCVQKSQYFFFYVV
ncbi:hypothetical protein Y032_0332g2747 [Ancylostoma ceylanicum]|uniref:Uncharacterized protein n=1 Tax=Ancylostoma ceylanicum TaxID=53326 RepID=A0A016RZ31_9BILA|nr:hypothetical protein Y032_0332g2747 [Ancylostoma ceylanicum]